MEKIRFDNRVVIVTGAGSGLGRTYAHEFARRGANVVVNDPGSARDGSGSNASAADTVVREIREAGGQAVASYDSVASMDGGRAIVNTAVDAYGKVDVLVNNAGILRDKSLLKLTEEDWDAVLDVHLKGSFCVSAAAFAVMKENGYGRIVNTASGAGLYGNFGQANYCSAKMGLVGLMNSLSIEGAKYNITCNTIAPVAASRMTEGLLPPEMLEKLKPEFIAPLVLFLSSDRNTDTKMIFNCAAGWFSRTEVMCSTGIRIGDGKRAIAPEEIMDNWDTLSGLDEAKPLGSVADTFGYLGGIL